MLNLWLYRVYLKALSMWIKKVKKNAKWESCFYIFNWISTWAQHLFLVFKARPEMSIKGISARYAAFIIWMSILKVIFNMDQNNSKKYKMGNLLLDF